MGADTWEICFDNQEKYDTKPIKKELEGLNKGLIIKEGKQAIDLETADITIGKVVDDQHFPVCVIEIKQLADLEKCLTKDHDRFRSQINSMRYEGVNVSSRVLLIIGRLDLLDDSKTKSYITISRELEHRSKQRVSVQCLPHLKFLAYYLHKTVEALKADPLTFYRDQCLERYNISSKRKKADEPREHLTLFLENIKGIKRNRALIISELHPTISEFTEACRKNPKKVFETINEKLPKGSKFGAAMITTVVEALGLKN